MSEDKEFLEEAIKHFKSLQKRYTREHNGKMCEKVAVALEALEKQVPKKPKEEWSKSPFSDDNGCLFQHLMCPNCGKMEVNKLDDFCPHCGQAIDWSDTE